MKGVVMNSVAGNYSVSNCQQLAFKGYKEAPQKIVRNPELIKAIRDVSVDAFWKRVRMIPFEVTMITIAKGLFAIKKGVEKACNIFKK